MSISTPAYLLDVDLRPGTPPLLQAAAGGDATRWAAEHRDAVRAAVAEHGSLLIRGLALGDVAGAAAVFARLASGLTTEEEAFAPAERVRRRRVLVHAVAGEPADVHAPRAELPRWSSPA